MQQIRINGRQAAQDWLRDAEALNDKTEKVLKEVSDALTLVQGGASGAIIDSIVEAGGKLLSGTAQVISGMRGISEVVNNLLSKVGEVMEEITSGIGNLLGNLFG